MEVQIDSSTELGKLLNDTFKEKPSPAARFALLDYIQKHGNAELARIGDLSKQIQTNIVKTAFAGNFGFIQAVICHLNNMKAEFGYDSAPPMEQMLIDHIALCWVRLHDCELRYDQVRNGNPTFDQGEYWEKKLSSNQRRFLRAVETLAKVRKLGVTVQVNIGDKQIITG